jgi:hypothetical protein
VCGGGIFPAEKVFLGEVFSQFVGKNVPIIAKFNGHLGAMASASGSKIPCFFNGREYYYQSALCDGHSGYYKV